MALTGGNGGVQLQMTGRICFALLGEQGTQVRIKCLQVIRLDGLHGAVGLDGDCGHLKS